MSLRASVATLARALLLARAASASDLTLCFRPLPAADLVVRPEATSAFRARDERFDPAEAYLAAFDASRRCVPRALWDLQAAATRARARLDDPSLACEPSHTSFLCDPNLAPPDDPFACHLRDEPSPDPLVDMHACVWPVCEALCVASEDESPRARARDANRHAATCARALARARSTASDSPTTPNRPPPRIATATRSRRNAADSKTALRIPTWMRTVARTLEPRRRENANVEGEGTETRGDVPGATPRSPPPSEMDSRRRPSRSPPPPPHRVRVWPPARWRRDRRRRSRGRRPRRRRPRQQEARYPSSGVSWSSPRASRCSTPSSGPSSTASSSSSRRVTRSRDTCTRTVWDHCRGPGRRRSRLRPRWCSETDTGVPRRRTPSPSRYSRYTRNPRRPRYSRNPRRPRNPRYPRRPLLRAARGTSRTVAWASAGCAFSTQTPTRQTAAATRTAGTSGTVAGIWGRVAGTGIEPGRSFSRVSGGRRRGSDRVASRGSARSRRDGGRNNRRNNRRRRVATRTWRLAARNARERRRWERARVRRRSRGYRWRVNARGCGNDARDRIDDWLVEKVSSRHASGVRRSRRGGFLFLGSVERARGDVARVDRAGHERAGRVGRAARGSA